jgi:hypothetical protein
MRSDFSHLCQSLPALVRLREGLGQVDLLVPFGGNTVKTDKANISNISALVEGR